MMRTALILAAAGMATARAEDRKPDAPYTDAAFVAMAASCCDGGMKAAELATTNAKSDAVKVFAKRMIEDHKKTGEKLAAAQKTSQSGATKLTDECQKCLDKLRDLKGEEFDAYFMTETVKGHEMAVKEFKRAKAETKDEAVKDFVASTLPILEKHLDIAKKIQADGK